MSEFDYRKFLAENKLTKVSRGRETGKAKILSEGIQIREGFDMDVDTEMNEANAQKDAYFKRKEREKRGNWGGSVGAFVEKHGEDLGRAGTNRQALVDYIETTMKPELNDEAKGYVDNLVATTKSSFKLLQALYNATMAGSGLSTSAGSLREEDWEGDDSLYESITVSKKYPQEKGSRTSVTSKKYKGKKAGDGQDRMAKSEMTGEKMDVTIEGVTKSISTREYKKYRKMTDPEEKKAWRKKHGFISEGKNLKKDRKRLLKESIQYTDTYSEETEGKVNRTMYELAKTILEGRAEGHVCCWEDISAGPGMVGVFPLESGEKTTWAEDDPDIDVLNEAISTFSNLDSAIVVESNGDFKVVCSADLDSTEEFDSGYDDVMTEFEKLGLVTW